MFFYDKEKSAVLSTKETSRDIRDINSSRARNVSNVRRGSRSASIPYKFVTKIIEVPKEKAFGNTSTRFTYKKEQVDQDQPGPGDYNLYRETLWRDNRASSSRKGFGNFVSKVYRTNKTKELLCNFGPGPGTYRAKQEMEIGYKPENAEKKWYPINPGPIHSHRQHHHDKGEIGPGYYQIERWQPHVPGNTAGVVFKSSSTRTDMADINPSTKMPSSWEYEISRDILKSKPFSLKGSSAFSQPAVAKAVKFTDYDKVRKMIVSKKPVTVEQIASPPEPGPGEYNVDEGFHNLKDLNYRTVKEPFRVTTRGSSHLVQNKNPGPGAYEIGSNFEDKKYEKFNSPFMSQTSRKAFDIPFMSNIHAPFSETLEHTKKEFNFSKGKKWI